MNRTASIVAALLAACVSWAAAAQQAAPIGKLPAQVILVRGAWSSASDALTPLPEGGMLSDSAYRNDYFDFAYALGADWTERFAGPPPSDGGYYVLAQIEPSQTRQSAALGHLMIAAQDMFFTQTEATTALELIDYYQAHLNAEYTVEHAPAPVRIAGQSFVRLDYMAPAAGLHWRVLATEIRCHTVQFVFTARSVKQMDELAQRMNTMRLPVAGAAPVCLKNFASAENVLEREDPIFTEPRFNAVPVRILIDTQGRIKHIHFLSAFPEQVSRISDALLRWRFRPYLVNGQPVEVETGLLFGRTPRPTASREP
jgi:hypothetical protein